MHSGLMMLSPALALEALPTPPGSSEGAQQPTIRPAVEPLRLAPSPLLQASTSSPPALAATMRTRPMLGLPSKPGAKRLAGPFPGGHSRKTSLPSPPSSDPVTMGVDQAVAKRVSAPARRGKLGSVKFSDAPKGSVNGSPHHRKWMPFVRSPVRRVNLNDAPADAATALAMSLNVLQSPTRRGPRITLSSSPLRRQAVIDEDDPFTDSASQMSDDDVRETLLPHLFMRPSRRTKEEAPAPLAPSSPDATSRRVRSILKKSGASIILGDDLERCTLANGRRRPGLGGNAAAGRATGKALMRVLNAGAEATDASGGAPPARDGAKSAGAGRLLPAASTSLGKQVGETGKDAAANDKATSNDKGKGRAPPVGDAEAERERNEEDIADVESALKTLAASLLPPPTEMRLDPISPLAHLATPQRSRLNELGSLVDSPREPSDVLPRPAPPTFPASKSLSSAPSANLGPDLMVEPSTPDLPSSSPIFDLYPRAVITLRDVEEAYAVLTSALENLAGKSQNIIDRVAKIIDDSADELARCCARDLINMMETPSGETTRPQRERSLSSSIEKAKAAKAAPGGAGTTAATGAATGGAKDKGGASTSQIRRKTAEIDAGQAVVKALSVLLSVPAWVKRIPDAELSNVIGLTLRIPETPALLKKKHLLILACQNRLLARQKAPLHVIGPLCPAIVTCITTSLYSQGGKSNERGRKVLVEGFCAIAGLAVQVPSAFIPHFGRFYEALLAGLTSPNAILRWAAVTALGAMVRGLHQDWTGMPPASGTGMQDIQDVDRSSLQQQISVCTLGYLQRMSPRDELRILDLQIGKAIQTYELGWALCTMGVVIAILGKRFRKLEADGPKMFTQRLQELIRKPNNIACRSLGYQLWDYVLWSWLASSAAAKSPNRVWALEGKPFEYLLQIIPRQSAFWRPAPESELPSPSSLQHMASTSRSILSLLYGTFGYTIHQMAPQEDPDAEPARFAHFDTVWKRIIVVDLPRMLEGASDECRVRAWEILAALLDAGEDASERAQSQARRWSPDRLLHPVLLDPPTSAAPPDNLLEEMASRGGDGRITPDELPALDCEWICTRAKLILPKLGVALVAAQQMHDAESIQWTRTSDGHRLCPAIYTTVWRRYLASLKAARAANPELEVPFRKAVRDVMLGIKNVIGPGNFALPPSAEDGTSLIHLGIRLFLHLYDSAHEILGAGVVSEMPVIWSDDFEDSSVALRLSVILIEDGVRDIFAEETKANDQKVYLDAVARLVGDAQQYVSVRHLIGIWKACWHPRLAETVAEIAMPSMYRKLTRAPAAGEEDDLASAGASLDLVRLVLESHANAEGQDTQLLNHLLSLRPAAQFGSLITECSVELAQFLATQNQKRMMPVLHTILRRLQEPEVAKAVGLDSLVDCLAAPLQSGAASSAAAEGLKAFWQEIAGTPLRARLGRHSRIPDLLAGIEMGNSQTESILASSDEQTQADRLESLGSLKLTQLVGVTRSRQPTPMVQDEPSVALEGMVDPYVDRTASPAAAEPGPVQASASVPEEADTAQIFDEVPEVQETEIGGESGLSSEADFLPQSYEDSSMEMEVRAAGPSSRPKPRGSQPKKRKAGSRLSMPTKKKSRSASFSSEVAPEDEDVVVVRARLKIKREDFGDLRMSAAPSSDGAEAQPRASQPTGLAVPSSSSSGPRKRHRYRRHISKDSLVFTGVAIPPVPARHASKSPGKARASSVSSAIEVPKVEVHDPTDEDDDDAVEEQLRPSQRPMRESDDSQVMASKLKGWKTRKLAKLNRVASGMLERRSEEPGRSRGRR